jgi:FKBP-type peptidyl-prolyl cis-trans isomerase
MILRTFAAFCVIVSAAACGSDSSPSNPSQVSNVPYSQTDLVVGTGRQAAVGNSVTVNYTLWLYSATATDNKGQQLDSSLSPGRTPLPVTVGTGVIPGFSQAIVGMAVGGRRRAVIPPNLAYGSAGSGSVPPNATLVFEIELLSIQ